MQNKITIVGAGPVGSLLAIYLARLGFPIDLYERRPDMRIETVDRGRSINLAVSVRGLHALGEVGLRPSGLRPSGLRPAELRDEVLKYAIPMKGRMIHVLDGSLNFQPYGKNESECIYSISRSELNILLMNEAEKKYGVKIYFNNRVQDVDFKNKNIYLLNEKTQTTHTISYNVLFAADGSGSAVRQAMLKYNHSTCSEDFLDYGYKELSISPGTSGGFKLERNALHIWPRGHFMLIALPNFDGSFTCTLFLPLRSSGKNDSFEELNDANAVENFFKTHFPDVTPLLENLTDTFFKNPTGLMVTVKSPCWTTSQALPGAALLIGDAAHAIVPFFGQGMNCGFEDCTLLNADLQRATRQDRLDWNELFLKFSRNRKPDCDAIADMAKENFIEMRDKVAQARFQLEKSVEHVLEERFPDLYQSRYRLVTFSRIPYREALKAGKLDDEILKALCKNIKSAAELDLKLAEKLIHEKKFE